MDINPYSITGTPGPHEITVAADFDISIAYRDSATGEVLLDRTGAASIRMSDLLASMSPEILGLFVAEVAPRMVAIAEGLIDG